ncbi:uncharacterized protein LOC110446726 [Mizuhopecten yessoensis]|uniref:uncharacterized protein LOC110446726 n=1 Tax=Mizuhopecten yessoensis TaxID=6573 RepID=UPI000B457A3A|nr:uncharacterized protein LOC110446726 [Mizuhopecten yessoensis]XP_021347682.1 uncharacterized protein LOC110446726 [Mizuhopecten yessoensis]XP_021347683.1 uncharacterized protein LOC110446726 [Mizuhopecten yessoensis]XP_021347684.1 uncharacterized protein LOC110446726 [Mizuhopecten yessoensis]XP_021347685.1 uncharacterized protein LOC110446726 [Mizuhopecten yessoensis]XP_021347686.1 uncharacterized protein LOC110446726 [Mizuhopecten yessoensis]
MKDKAHVGIAQQNTQAFGANRKRTFLFVTRLCAALVSHELLSAMVLGAPSNTGPELLTDYRFTYNTTDTYVDRVCRRAPVLLDPSAALPCRIVDRNCVVDDPCARPDPVERLLNTAPCPPVSNPTLICLFGIRAKLECPEKFEILRKCFLSPNKTIYDLKNQTESCHLKRACGQWLRACPNELSRLSDVFVNCAAPQNPVTEIVPTHSTNNVPTVDRSTDMPTHSTNNVPNVDRSTDMPGRTTYPTDLDNATHPTHDVPDPEPAAILLFWRIAGIFLPVCLIFTLFVFCKRRDSRRKKKWMPMNKRTSGLDQTPNHTFVDVFAEIAPEDRDVETTPFLADGPVATGETVVFIQDTGNHLESKAETEKHGISTVVPQKNVSAESKYVPQEHTPCSVDTQKTTEKSELISPISPEISVSKTETENDLEKSTEDIQTNETSGTTSVDAKINNLRLSDTDLGETNLETENPGIPQNKSVPVNTDHEETNLETEKQKTPTDPQKSTVPESTDVPHISNRCSVDTQKTTGKSVLISPISPEISVSKTETENDLEKSTEDIQTDETSGTTSVDAKINNLRLSDTDLEGTNLETENPGIPQNKSVPVNTDHEETNLETEKQKTPTDPQNSTVPESKDVPHISNRCSVDNQEQPKTGYFLGQSLQEFQF